MIRVALAEDHDVVRQGLRSLLEQSADMRIVGEADDGSAAIDMVEQVAPDVLIMDIGLPNINGIQATAKIRARFPATAIVILSMYSDDTLARQALRNGAHGYILKRSSMEEILLAIRAAARGETFLSPAIAGPLLADVLAHPTLELSLADRLTEREHEVLQLVAEGWTNSVIAGRLQLSVKTIEKHRASLMRKLQVHDLAGLLRVAIQHGLVVLDQ
jgi:DNA-binding NarL/FixJ family response regulator